MTSHRRGVDRRLGEARAVARAGKAAQEDVDKQTALRDTFERAAAVLNTLSDQRQRDAQTKIEALVTRGLQTIFEDNLSFHVVQEVKANRVQVQFVVRTELDGGEIVETPVMDARGGGLAATVGFLLRLVVLLLSGNREPHVLMLDETFAHLSADYEPRLAEFIREIVDQTDLQIVMVTHSDAYSDQADKVYRFSQLNGSTKVASA